MICNVCNRETFLRVRKNTVTEQGGYICDECYLGEVKERWVVLDKEDIAKIRRRIEEKIRKNQELIPILAVQLHIQMDDVLQKEEKSIFPRYKDEREEGYEVHGDDLTMLTSSKYEY